MLRVLRNTLCNLKVKINGERRVFAMVYHRVKSSLKLKSSHLSYILDETITFDMDKFN